MCGKLRKWTCKWISYACQVTNWATANVASTRPASQAAASSRLTLARAFSPKFRIARMTAKATWRSKSNRQVLLLSVRAKTVVIGNRKAKEHVKVRCTKLFHATIMSLRAASLNETCRNLSRSYCTRQLKVVKVRKAHLDSSLLSITAFWAVVRSIPIHSAIRRAARKVSRSQRHQFTCWKSSRKRISHPRK